MKKNQKKARILKKVLCNAKTHEDYIREAEESQPKSLSCGAVLCYFLGGMALHILFLVVMS